MSGYSEAGGSHTRRNLRAFIPNSNSPQEDIASIQTLRGRSRLLFYSTPIASSAIKTNRSHVVGQALELQCSIDRETLGISEEEAAAWQRRTEKEFKLWASKAQNCDASGINNFYEIQQLALMTWLLSGDVFAVRQSAERTKMNPYSLRYRLIEADRVCNPEVTFNGTTEYTIPEKQEGAGNTVYDGVELDKSGKVVAYHICNKYPNSSNLLSKTDAKWERVLAYGEKTGLPIVLHCFDSERPDQYRGIPLLAPVIESLIQIRRFNEAELTAAYIQACFTAFIKKKDFSGGVPINEAEPPSGGNAEPGMKNIENASGGRIETSEDEYKIAPGQINFLDEGDEAVFGNPNVPTAGFSDFMKFNAIMIGAALEIPYDVLMKEFNSSFSAARGALLEAWETFNMRRRWLVDDFCNPVYETWLTEAIAIGRISAPGFFDDPLIRAAWCGARWVGPVKISLDPVKEVNAAVTQIQHGLTTRQQQARELGGGDFYTNVSQAATEHRLMKESGLMEEIQGVQTQNTEESEVKPKEDV